MKLIEISTGQADGQTTTVEVTRETPKAIRVAGNCSNAWIPKSALENGADGGQVAQWFQNRFTFSHCMFWEAPRDPNKH